ncbi:MAG: dethiobiotin synthase [Actinomycetia bacterium]|nr:dethiobiotin synthase [Actinomycetes bacterium]
MGESPQRPRAVVAIAGTGTEVGKTWVSAAVLRGLAERGLTVCARKPAQSFDPADASSGVPTDADVLAAATGEAIEAVCPRNRYYPVAMAPPMAADALDLPPVRLEQLVGETRTSWPDRQVDLALVETAGGVRSPIAHDGDCARFVSELEVDEVVLVADAGLGTISAVRSAIDSLESEDVADGDITPYLNRWDESDELHRRNRAWLEELTGRPVLTSVDDLTRRLGGLADLP